MSQRAKYLAMIELDDQRIIQEHLRDLEHQFHQFEPAVDHNRRGRIAVRLRVEAISLPQAAMLALAAVLQVTHADTVSLAVMPEEEFSERSADDRAVDQDAPLSWFDGFDL